MVYCQDVGKLHIYIYNYIYITIYIYTHITQQDFCTQELNTSPAFSLGIMPQIRTASAEWRYLPGAPGDQMQSLVLGAGDLFIWLVVSNIFYFPFHIWDVILPIDFHIFHRGRSTTNQLCYFECWNSCIHLTFTMLHTFAYLLLIYQLSIDF